MLELLLDLDRQLKVTGSGIRALLNILLVNGQTSAGRSA
jgi:hypothetical protein